MALSNAKREKMARREREEYVRRASFGGRIVAPFSEHSWDTAAREYIETGDESLKARFPRPRD